MNIEDTKEAYTYNTISPIFKNKNYKYSHYEIKILSDYLNINVILLGKNNTNKLPNGVRCFNNNSNKYLLFNIVNNEYDKCSIIRWSSSTCDISSLSWHDINLMVYI